jgi:hypothetical protein
MQHCLQGKCDRGHGYAIRADAVVLSQLQQRTAGCYTGRATGASGTVLRDVSKNTDVYVLRAHLGQSTAVYIYI